MSDDQKGLDIKITTKADLTGAQQTTDAIGKLTGAQKDQANAANDVVQVTQKDIEASGAAKEATSKLEVSKRELREVINHLTRGFPILGEVMRAALNPIVFLIAAPIAAFEIFRSRVDAAADALGNVEMPDLTEGIEQAAQLREHWNGIAEAITKANQEFNSADSVFNRQKDAIDHQLDADKKLLEVDKTRALANLDTVKAQMSPEQYAYNNAQIENAYAQKELGLETEASQQRQAAKYRELFAAKQQAQESSAAAAGIKLPEDDKEVDAQIEAQKKRADTHREDAKNAQAQLDFIGQLGSNSTVQNQLDYFKFYQTYGNGASVGYATDVESKKFRDATDQANLADEAAARIQAQKEERDRLRQEAATAAGKAATIGNTLPDYIGHERLGQNTARAGTQGQIGANWDKFISETTGNGADLTKLFQEYHQASIGNQRDLKAALAQALGEINQLRQQTAQAAAAANLH
jgi:hypothetical protein